MAHRAGSRPRNRAPESDDKACPRQPFQEEGSANQVKLCEPRFICAVIVIALSIYVAGVIIYGSARYVWTLREESRKLEGKNEKLSIALSAAQDENKRLSSKNQLKTSKLEQDLRIERESWHVSSALIILVIVIIAVLMAILMVLGCVALWHGK